jgi:uncharacterized protein YozE (UPF0346 family)
MNQLDFGVNGFAKNKKVKPLRGKLSQLKARNKKFKKQMTGSQISSDSLTESDESAEFLLANQNKANIEDNIASFEPADTLNLKKTKTKAAAKKKPFGPKRPLSAYFWFMKVQKRKNEHKGTTVLAQVWQRMTAEDRKPFDELHDLDRERYSEQQKDFRETGKFIERNDDYILNRA